MKKLIVVPTWIQGALERERRSIVDVLSFQKLSEVISFADIQSFLLLQSHAFVKNYHIGVNDATALVSAWSATGGEDKASEFSSLVNPTTQESLNKDKLNLLINGEERDSEKEKWHGVFHGDHNNLLLVLKSGHFGSQDYEEQDANIVENILRVLYGEFVQEEVAQTPIFKRYVALLSNRVI